MSTTQNDWYLSKCKINNTKLINTKNVLRNVEFFSKKVIKQ